MKKPSFYKFLTALFISIAFISTPQLSFAQWENDDTYDPFADYSDYEATAEEEADINFFKTGRLFTMGFQAGYRNFTQELKNEFGGGTSFGLFLSYFFDLRFALQFGFSISDHSLALATQSPVNGNVELNDITMALKYYINTQSVTKGLSKLNPYLTFGVTSMSRTFTTNLSTFKYGKDSANGFTVGAGIEIPAMRNKMYYGGQVTYTSINMANENVPLQVPDGSGPSVVMNGDPYQLLFILGVNF